ATPLLLSIDRPGIVPPLVRLLPDVAPPPVVPPPLIMPPLVMPAPVVAPTSLIVAAPAVVPPPTRGALLVVVPLAMAAPEIESVRVGSVVPVVAVPELVFRMVLWGVKELASGVALAPRVGLGALTRPRSPARRGWPTLTMMSPNSSTVLRRPRVRIGC